MDRAVGVFVPGRLLPTRAGGPNQGEIMKAISIKMLLSLGKKNLVLGSN